MIDIKKENNIGILNLIGLIGIYIFGITFLISRAGNNIGYGIAGLAFIILLFMKKIALDWKDKILMGFLGMFGLVIILNLISPGGLESAIKGIESWHKNLIFILLIVFVKTKKEIKTFLFLILLSMLISALYGYATWEGDLHIRLESFAGCMSLAHPLALSMAYLLAYILFNRDSDIKLKISAVLIYLLSFGNLYLTQTRGAWLGWGISTLVILALYKKRAVLIFVLIGAGLILISPGMLQERAASITSVKTNAERLSLWKAAIYTYSKNPILGSGTGNGKKYFAEYMDKNKTGFDDFSGNAHSTYLSILSQNGIMILMFLYMVLYVLPMRIYKEIKIRNNKSEEYWLLIGSLGGLLSFLVSGIAQNVYSNQISGMAFGIVIYFVYILSKKNEKLFF